MSKKLLNKFGLFTSNQLAHIISDQSLRQARSFRDTYENMRIEKINDIQKSLERLLQTYKIDKEDLYLSITPFFDSTNEFYWIVTQVPKINRYKTPGEINVKSCFLPPRDQIGFLYYDICADSALNPLRIKITDFRIVHNNRGIGTYVLNKLESIASMLNIKSIYGELCPVDIQNRDAQVRFYSRNGYDIKFKDATRLEGRILKKIELDREVPEK